MLPQWMKDDDNYIPLRDRSRFAERTIGAIGRAMSRLRVQKGHEKKHHLPASFKIILLIVLIAALSVTRNRTLILIAVTAVQVYLCTWPARDILAVLKSSTLAAVLALILFAPAMIMNPKSAANGLTLVVKVFTSVEMVNIFNHTTQWNHMTAGLRKLHVPAVIVFTIDITLKYIVLLGTLINDLFISLALRSVGRNNRKYQSLGGVAGITFLRSNEMSREMYQAMQCRGFTDDYKGL